MGGTGTAVAAVNIIPLTSMKMIPAHGDISTSSSGQAMLVPVMAVMPVKDAD